VCLRLPGALPVVNEAAVESAVKVGKAIDADVPEETTFHRKNYYYPDLPKNSRSPSTTRLSARTASLSSPTRAIAGPSTFARRTSKRTRVDQARPRGQRTARFAHDGHRPRRLHPHRLQPRGHAADGNRHPAGLPGPGEVRAFLEKLEEVLEYLGIFDATRDGSLRIDANPRWSTPRRWVTTEHRRERPGRRQPDGGQEHLQPQRCRAGAGVRGLPPEEARPVRPRGRTGDSPLQRDPRQHRRNALEGRGEGLPLLPRGRPPAAQGQPLEGGDRHPGTPRRPPRALRRGVRPERRGGLEAHEHKAGCGLLRERRRTLRRRPRGDVGRRRTAGRTQLPRHADNRRRGTASTR